MNREIDTLLYDNKKFDFIELLYYNGSKLCVNMEQQYILAWNKEFSSYERWFLIKVSETSFNGYISGDLTLLDVMKSSQVEIIQRQYDNYENLAIVDSNPNLEEYKLPGNISYLGFDFLSEYNYSTVLTNYHRSYSIQIVSKESMIVNSKSNNENIWTNLRVNANHYTKREVYVA